MVSNTLLAAIYTTACLIAGLIFAAQPRILEQSNRDLLVLHYLSGCHSGFVISAHLTCVDSRDSRGEK